MKKQQKKKNPFKVDHVRSIKLKAKAKQYTGNLKQLKAIVSEKVQSTNEQLSSLQDVVRQAPSKEIPRPNSVTTKKPEAGEKSREQIKEEFRKSQECEADALDKLTSWKCSS